MSRALARLFVAFVVFVVLGALAACGDDSLEGFDQNGDARCEVHVMPAALQLGVVEIGTTTTRTIIAANRGGARCTLLTVSKDSRDIELEAPALPYDLEPGMTVVVTARITLSAPALSEGTITLSWANGEVSEVRVTAIGATAELTIIPQMIDVEARVGCTERRTITVGNTTPFPVRLRSSLNASPAFTHQSRSEVMLAAGDLFPIDLDFRPERIDSFGGTLEIDWDHGLVFVPLTGRGVPGPRKIDVFHLLDPSIDLLLVIDDGPSMIEEQQSIADNLAALRASFLAHGYSGHFGVTTADTSSTGAAGRILPLDNPRIVGLDAPWEDWRALIDVGTNGSTVSRGLDAALRARTRPLTETDNYGLFRVDTWPLIILISDNEDS